MPETLTRPNRYAASCVRCGGRIKAGEGLLVRLDNGGWAADHPEQCPDRPAPAAASIRRADTDGIYRTDDGAIFKVQIAHNGSGRLYAKRLEVTTCGGCEHCDGEDTCKRGKFVYAPGAIHTLRADQRLDRDTAAQYGRLYGCCIVCGATLTDEDSIAAGIGPICGGRKWFGE